MGKLRLMGLLLALCTIFLASCAGGKDPAALVVEQYLKGMVAGDANQTSKLACKEFEDQAVKDADSFGGVKAELVNAVCTKSGTDGSTVLVGCSGTIAATYGNEVQKFDLAGPMYKVVQQGGSWLVCGR
jgi:hypothetical protein